MPLKLERVWTSGVKAVRSWGPTFLIVAASVSVGAFLAGRRSSGPTTPAAERVAAIGRTYPRDLGAAYAAAWIKGAESLESGRPVPESLDVVAREWSAGRIALFDRAVASEFAGVVPEGKPDDEVSAADKAALAALWRAFASGLAKPAK